VGASSVDPAVAEESTAIKCGSEAKKTTEAIEKAVEKGGTYVLECFESLEIARKPRCYASAPSPQRSRDNDDGGARCRPGQAHRHDLDHRAEAGQARLKS
jgi:hypothetical protein